MKKGALDLMLSDMAAEMERRRLTPAGLAALAGVPAPTAAAILAGLDPCPPPATVVKLADALDPRKARRRASR
jgi:hypothetical protein